MSSPMRKRKDGVEAAGAEAEAASAGAPHRASARAAAAAAAALKGCGMTKVEDISEASHRATESRG